VATRVDIGRSMLTFSQTENMRKVDNKPYSEGISPESELFLNESSTMLRRPARKLVGMVPDRA